MAVLSMATLAFALNLFSVASLYKRRFVLKKTVEEDKEEYARLVRGNVQNMGWYQLILLALIMAGTSIIFLFVFVTGIAVLQPIWAKVMSLLGMIITFIDIGRSIAAIIKGKVYIDPFEMWKNLVFAVFMAYFMIEYAATYL